MATEEKPRALIYNDDLYPGHNPGLFHLSRRVAIETDWQPIPYDDLELAVEEFDGTIDALIAILTPTSMSEGLAERLFQKSDELYVPRAIISADTSSDGKIRDSSDILIDSASAENVQNKLARWLLLINS